MDLLDLDINRTGKFNLPIPKLISNYKKMPLGKFETIYSIGNGKNEDIAILVLIVIKDSNAGVNNMENIARYSNLSQTLSILENASRYFNS